MFRTMYCGSSYTGWRNGRPSSRAGGCTAWRIVSSVAPSFMSWSVWSCSDSRNSAVSERISRTRSSPTTMMPWPGERTFAFRPAIFRRAAAHSMQ